MAAQPVVNPVMELTAAAHQETMAQMAAANAAAAAVAVAGEPAAKRPRGEDHLLSEHDFLLRNGGPSAVVHFGVLCPLGGAEKAEWRLQGQTVAVGPLKLTDTVATIKAK